MQVKDVMRQPFVITKDMSVSEAAKIMSNKDIGCLIFMKDDKIKGIITERDIIKNFHENKKVSDVMSENLVTIDSEKEINRAFLLMKSKKIKRLPVVDEGKLVGIVTVTDLIANYNEIEEGFFFS